MLIPILDTLSPIIQLIGDAFVWLYNNAIMPFANLVIEAGNILYNAMVSVYNWLNNLWGGEDMAAKSNDSGKLTSITGSDLAAAGTDDSSSVSSGSYDSSYLGYALGTDYSPAGSYVVGEYRPEIVTLPQGSRVSSSIGASGIGSKSNNLTFNISAGEKASAADIMRESRRTMRALNVAGVL
jgi:SLT domain-containing protein